MPRAAQAYTEHVGQCEADKYSHSDDQAWDNGRLVAQGQAKDDIGGSTGAARVSHVLCKSERYSVACKYLIRILSTLSEYGCALLE